MVWWSQVLAEDWPLPQPTLVTKTPLGGTAVSPEGVTSSEGPRWWDRKPGRGAKGLRQSKQNPLQSFTHLNKVRRTKTGMGGSVQPHWHHESCTVSSISLPRSSRSACSAIPEPPFPVCSAPLPGQHWNRNGHISPKRDSHICPAALECLGRLQHHLNKVITSLYQPQQRHKTLLHTPG